MIENVIENAEFGGIYTAEGIFQGEEIMREPERECVKFQIVPMVNNGYVSE